MGYVIKKKVVSLRRNSRPMACPKLSYHLSAEPRLRCVYNVVDGEESYVSVRKDKPYQYMDNHQRIMS